MKEDKKERREDVIFTKVLVVILMCIVLISLSSGIMAANMHKGVAKEQEANGSMMKLVEVAETIKPIRDIAIKVEVEIEYFPRACIKKQLEIIQYCHGMLSAEEVILFANMREVYFRGDISLKQFEEYLELRESFLELVLSDSEIPHEEIEKYNGIINCIPIPSTNYECASDLELTDGGLKQKGFRDRIILQACYAIIEYYHEQIPKEKYDNFQAIIEQTTYREERVTTAIDYGKNLIEEYIGQPSEVFMLDDWQGARVVIMVPEK